MEVPLEMLEESGGGGGGVCVCVCVGMCVCLGVNGQGGQRQAGLSNHNVEQVASAVTA